MQGLRSIAVVTDDQDLREEIDEIIGGVAALRFVRSISRIRDEVTDGVVLDVAAARIAAALKLCCAPRLVAANPTLVVVHAAHVPAEIVNRCFRAGAQLAAKPLRPTTSPRSPPR